MTDYQRQADGRGPAGDFARLILVRHGETAWNQDRRIQGQIDIALNAVGERQARAAARALADEPVVAIYASDLSRAHRTASLIAEPRGLPVAVDPRLRERHWGRLQGSRFQDLALSAPADHDRVLARDPTFDLGDGESLDVLMQRVAGVLSELALRHAGQTIVAVAHGGVLDCAHRLASGLALSAPRDFSLHNAGINILRGEGQAGAAARFAIEHWGRVDHLADSADEIDPRGRPAGLGRPGDRPR